jgi:IstB-like ATP binding protein
LTGAEGVDLDSVEPEIRALLVKFPDMPSTVGYSRVIAAVTLPSRQSADLLAGHWALLSGWGRVPRALVWDNESAVGQWRAGRPVLTEAMNTFRGRLVIKVIQCQPKDPEAKGLVELFLGPAGTGKTHLSIGLGIRACQAGHRTAFATAAEWVARLADAHHAGRLQDELVKLGRIPLSIVNEVGCAPRGAEESCGRRNPPSVIAVTG